MLDKSKLIAQLQSVAEQLFVDHNATYDYIEWLWRIIIQDPLFLHKVKEVHNAPWPIPLWDGNLKDIFSISDVSTPYIVLSVDGSQIYPDRHHISSCFLINTGSVLLPYGVPLHHVEFSSIPTVFTGVDENEIPYTTDTVNCKRQELELQEGLALAVRVTNENSDVPVTVLFDGSLIFWHLAAKEKDIRDLFLNSYCTLLHELYHKKVITAWYISAPKSKELINLVRLYLCDFDHNNTSAYSSINRVTDEHIMQSFLAPHTRSIIFKNCSNICDYYPSVVRPYFFYLNTGVEIGRVEIPAWIAHDDNVVNHIAAVITDQCKKGGGYPVALAEAHEQAVIKGPDRDFFYHVLQKMIIERGKKVSVSCKSLKKRGINI